MSYIVRDEEFPDAGLVYATFNDRMVNKAPQTGQYYIADSRRIHNLLVGFLQGENSEDWICSIAKYKDGRRDMIALRRHFAGEGNSARCIADAKRLQATLHYKTERALPSSKFLVLLQKMFTIFEDKNELLTERAKVDEVLSKVQATTLSAAVVQLRYQLTNTVGVTFTVAANHLNAEISQTSDYQLAWIISAVGTGRGNGGTGGRGTGRGGRGGQTGGRGRGGRGGHEKSSSGYYSAAEWEKLSYTDCDKICKERDKRGEQGGSKRFISELTAKQLTTTLISLLQKINELEEPAEKSEASRQLNQAGNAFCGREGAKRQKNSEW